MMDSAMFARETSFDPGNAVLKLNSVISFRQESPLDSEIHQGFGERQIIALSIKPHVT